MSEELSEGEERLTPLVSICCLSYNHSPFIRKCLDGFLMQETTFPLEILIHDDASTDGTDEIVREYAANYPDKIFPLFEEKNKYSNGYKGRMDFFNYNRARGKYIATCEGDDYWTDPLKLQKQVDFMETHPDFSVCFHRCKHRYSAEEKYVDDDCGFLFVDGQDGVEVTRELFFKHWVTQPLSMLFRFSSFDYGWQKKYKHYRDVHEIYHLLNEGKGWIFSFVGGVYNKHEQGISSMIEAQSQYAISYNVSKELYDVNKDIYTKKNYADNLRWLIGASAEIDGVGIWYLIARYLLLSSDLKFVLKMIIRRG